MLNGEGNVCMKIAVACDGLLVAPLTSRCESFTCYAVEHGIIAGCCNVPNMGVTIQESIDILKKMDADVLIARSFGTELDAALEAAGIDRVTLDEESPRLAAESYLHATLMGETGLTGACEASEPLDELDDAFARIEYKLVARSA